MSITRTALANYLHLQFSGLAAAIGQSANNHSSVGYGPDIDNAFRKLGIDESALPTATATDAQRAAIFALSEYYAAQRFWRQLSDRANVKVDDSQFDYKQVLTNAQTLTEKAAKQCAALGLIVDGSVPRGPVFRVF